MACEFCTEPIGLDQPATEFLCHHKVHTECALRNFMANQIHHIRCPACDEQIVPAEMVHENNTVHGPEAEAEVLRYLWESEPEFKTHLEAIRDARNAMRQSGNTLSRRAKVLRQQQMADLEPLLAQVRERVAATKAEFKDLPERKEHTKATSKYTARLTSFHRRWGVWPLGLRYILPDITALRAILEGGGRWVRRRNLQPYQFGIHI